MWKVHRTSYIVYRCLHHQSALTHTIRTIYKCILYTVQCTKHWKLHSPKSMSSEQWARQTIHDVWCRFQKVKRFTCKWFNHAANCIQVSGANFLQLSGNRWFNKASAISSNVASIANFPAFAYCKSFNWIIKSNTDACIWILVGLYAKTTTFSIVYTAAANITHFHSFNCNNNNFDSLCCAVPNYAQLCSIHNKCVYWF